MISMKDKLYLKRALAIGCENDSSLDIPRLNEIVGTLLNIGIACSCKTNEMNPLCKVHGGNNEE